MKYLDYEVKNMAISKANGERANPVSGAVNYYGLHFTFDEEFSEIAGTKSVEFYKSRKNIRVDLVDGLCAIPNEMISDKNPFDIRVICGGVVATPWTQVTVSESGAIYTENPQELPETTEYVKTPAGDDAISMLRKGTNGLEFSQDGGTNWEGSVSGVPEVPKTPKDVTYLRKNGDWIQYTEPEGLIGTATVLAELDSEADLSAVISKVNEIVVILKDRGITT